MKNIKYLYLKILLLIPFLFGWLIYRGMISSLPLRIFELGIYSLVLIFIVNKRIRWPSLSLLLFTLIIWFTSALISNTSLVLFLFFIRSMLLYYIIVVYISNLNSSEIDLKNLFFFIWGILLIQIPVSFFKYFTIGIGETPLGLCGTSWTTFVFLISVSYSLSFFIVTKDKKYVFYTLGFMIFGLVGGKRAIMFFFPVLLLFLLIIHDYKKILSPKVLFITLIIVISFGYVAVRVLPTLNPDNKIGGRFSFGYLIEYSNTYNNAETFDMGAIGRSSALDMAIAKVQVGGWSTLLFGDGAGILTKTSISEFDNRDVVKEKYNIGYGVTGLIFLLIQVGLIGSIVFFIFLISLGKFSWRLRKVELMPFWKAFHLGTLGVIFTISIIAYFYDVIYKEPVVISYVYSLVGISASRYYMLLRSK